MNSSALNASNLADLIDQAAGKAQRSDSITLGAFLSSFGLSLLIWIIGTGIFLSLKDRCQNIYQPRSINPHDFSTQALPSGVIGWMRVILLTSSDTVLQQCGLDAYLFLRFLGGASIFFALASVVVCPILLPWNAVLNSEGKRVGLSRLQWAGVGAGPGYRWVNTLVTLFMAAAFCGVVNREMRETIRLRELEQWFPANRNQLLVLLRRETSQTSRRWWDNYDHRKVKPAVLFGEHQKVLSTAINEQTSARDRLEEALTRFISQSISSINKKVDVEEICAKEYISAWLDHSCPRQSSSSASLWGWIRAIFWKLSKGQEIDDAVQKLAQATLKVQQVRESPLESPSASSIALQFPDPLSAALAHQTLDCHDLLSTTTPCVVHRDDVDWRQISVGGVERRVRLWVTRLVLGIAIIGWTVPVALSGSMAQLSALSPYVVTLSWLDQLPSVVISILQGCLPPLATSIVILLFVPLLRFILSQRRCVTQQEIELAAQRYHFAFVFVHLFLTVSVASGLTASLYQIIINPNATLTLLADNLPKASNFFLSDVPLRAFSFAGVTYSQVNTLLLNHFPNPRHTITPRQWYARQHSRDIRQWGTLVSMHTLLADIVLIYAPIAPLILPIGALAFALFWQGYRYHFLCVGRGVGHCRGQIHLQMLSHMFWGSYTQQACTIGLFGLSGLVDRSTSTLVHLALRAAGLLGTVWFHHHWRAFCSLRLRSAILPPQNMENTALPAARMVESVKGNQDVYPRDSLDDKSGSRHLLIPGDTLGVSRQIVQWLARHYQIRATISSELQVDHHGRTALQRTNHHE